MIAEKRISTESTVSGGRQGSLSRVAAMPTRPMPQESAHVSPRYPERVEQFLSFLRSDWPDTATSCWDDEKDGIAYARQVLTLSQMDMTEVYFRLRERHTFRPSVAEVRAVVDELLTQTNPTHKLTDAEIKMRTVHTMPRALPSAANGPHREAARREIARRRAQANLVPVAERKAENQAPGTRKLADAPASLPLSWVGLLVVALVDGRDVRGVVWSEEGDTLTIKGSGGDKFAVDKAFVRVELARESGGAA